jgi:hypothetical protein
MLSASPSIENLVDAIYSCTQCSMRFFPYSASPDHVSVQQFMCQSPTPHPLCNACAATTTHCPTCNSPIECNTILDNSPLLSPVPFLQSIIRRCKYYPKCEYVAIKPDDISLHESTQCIHAHITPQNQSIEDLFSYAYRFRHTNVITDGYVYYTPAIRISPKIIRIDFVNPLSICRVIIEIDMTRLQYTVVLATTPVKIHIETSTSDTYSSAHPHYLSSGPVGHLSPGAELRVEIVPIFVEHDIIPVPVEAPCSQRVCRWIHADGPHIGSRPIMYPQQIAIFATMRPSGTIIRVSATPTTTDFVFLLSDHISYPMDRLATCPGCLNTFTFQQFLVHLDIPQSLVEANAFVVDVANTVSEWVVHGSPISPCANRLAGGDAVLALAPKIHRDRICMFPMANQLADIRMSSTRSIPHYFGFLIEKLDTSMMVTVAYDPVAGDAMSCPICNETHENTTDPTTILSHLGFATTPPARLVRIQLASSMDYFTIDNSTTIQSFIAAAQTEFS